MGRKVRRAAFVPRAVFSTVCTVTVVPAIVQSCWVFSSSAPGEVTTVAAGFGGTGGRGGFGGTATGGTGATGGSGGSGGFAVAAGFGGTPDSGSDAADALDGPDAPDAADAGPTDASGSASLDVADSARFGELALVPNRGAISTRGRRRWSGKRRPQRRRRT